LVDIQRWCTPSADTALFDSVVVFENYPVAPALAGNRDAQTAELSVSAVAGFEEGIHFPLCLVVGPGRTITLRLAFSRRRFDVEAIRRLADDLTRLLAAIAADPDRRLARLWPRPRTDGARQMPAWRDGVAHSDLTLVPRRVRGEPATRAVVSVGPQVRRARRIEARNAYSAAATAEPAAAVKIVALNDRALRRAMVYFVVPQTAGAVLQLASSTITVVYFGRLLGPSALAVASVFFPVFLLLVSFLVGLVSSGGVVLVGRAYGAGDTPQVKRVAGTTLSVCILLSLGIAALGYRFSPELLGIMQTPADIQSAAVDYARVTFASLPVLTVFFAYTYLLRGTGDSQTPFLAVALCIAISLILTPALIQGWLGLPMLGSASAPWANLAACAISLPILLAYLSARGHPLALDGILIRRLRSTRRSPARSLASACRPACNSQWPLCRRWRSYPW